MGRYSGGHLVAELGEPIGHRGADGDDVFLAGHEDEDVAGRLREVDLHRLLDRALDVVLARRLGVEDVDGEGAAGDLEHGHLAGDAGDMWARCRRDVGEM